MAEETLEARVANWLKDQGYPLEIKTADSFVRAGFSVTQSDYYIDPQSEQRREIDVRAYLQKPISDTFFRLATIVECKAADAKPWVVFTSDRIKLADRARVTQRSETTLGRYWLEAVSSREEVCNLSVFQLPSRPGYGMTAAFTERLDIPYGALMAAATAAYAESLAGNSTKQREFFSISFPVVITEAPLLACSLGEDGNLQIERVPRAVITWRNPVYRMPHCIIDVVHSDEASNFISRLKDDFSFLIENTAAEMDAAIKRRKGDRFVSGAVIAGRAAARMIPR